MEQGAVEKLIIWEHLDIKRYVFRNPTSEGKKVSQSDFDDSPLNLAEEIKYLRPEQERDRSFFVDKASGVELEVMETMEFIEWLVETDET